MEWYFAEGGRQVGPLSDEAFKDLARVGRITPETLVWRDGMTDWQPYRKAVPAGYEKQTPNQDAVRQGAGDRRPAQRSTPAREDFSPHQQKPQPGGSERTAIQYGGFWIRLVAKIIDSFLIAALAMLALIVIGIGCFILIAISSGNPQDLEKTLADNPVFLSMFIVFSTVIQIAIPLVYSTFFLGKFDATPGKMICRLKVMTSEGGSVSYGRAFARGLGEILSGMICDIGYIIAGFDSQKRALHDHLCGTRVIKT